MRCVFTHFRIWSLKPLSHGRSKEQLKDILFLSIISGLESRGYKRSGTAGESLQFVEMKTSRAHALCLQSYVDRTPPALFPAI